MYPVIPTELIQSTAALMVYFVTIAGAVPGIDDL